MNSPQFLKYRPSQIAACAVIIAINIQKRSEMLLRATNSPRATATTPLAGRGAAKKLSQIISSDSLMNNCDGDFEFKTAFWNNERVLRHTGYTIEMLKEPLYHLSTYLKQSHITQKMEHFNLEGIRELKNFKLEKPSSNEIKI